MATSSMTKELYKTIEKELKSRDVVEAFQKSYEQVIESLREELIRMNQESRQQNKYELRDELTKELVTKSDMENTRVLLKADIDQVRSELKQVHTELKADISQVRTELKADIKLTNLKTMFQTAIIIVIILAATPGGTNLLEKIFPFIR